MNTIDRITFLATVIVRSSISPRVSAENQNLGAFSPTNSTIYQKKARKSRTKAALSGSHLVETSSITQTLKILASQSINPKSPQFTVFKAYTNLEQSDTHESSSGEEVGRKDLHPAAQLVEEIRSQVGAGWVDGEQGSWQRPGRYRIGAGTRCCWRPARSSARLCSSLS